MMKIRIVMMMMDGIRIWREDVREERKEEKLAEKRKERKKEKRKDHARKDNSINII